MPDFTQPQRQSLAGIVIMFLDTARGFVAALWPILLITVLRSDRMKLAVFGISLAIFALVTAVIAWLRYRNFTFFIDEENAEFVLSDGILNKSRTVIGLDKIQQVSITQSFLQQIIGVHAVEIDTAGSASKEVKIKAVSHQLAQALKSRLLEAVLEKHVESQVSQSGQPVISITPGSLFKVGLTSNYIRTIGILLAFSISVWEQIRQVIDTDIIDDSALDNYMENDFGFSSVLVFLGFLMAVVLVFNIGRIMLRYYNYKISVQGRQLLLSYGLLGTKNTIIRPGRVQITAVSQNFFQKKLGVLEMRVAQAGMETDEHHNKKNRGVDIPGCNATERDEILALLYRGLPSANEELKPNIRKLLFSVFFSIVLPLGVFLSVWACVPDAANYLGLVVVLAALVLLANFMAFRNYRLFAGSRLIVKKSGVWDVTREYIEVGKIQSISVSQRFWHKTTDIGTLTVHTAGGDVSFRLGNFTQIRLWANQWLYAIEKENTNWM